MKWQNTKNIYDCFWFFYFGNFKRVFLFLIFPNLVLLLMVFVSIEKNNWLYLGLPMLLHFSIYVYFPILFYYSFKQIIRVENNELIIDNFASQFVFSSRVLKYKIENIKLIAIGGYNSIVITLPGLNQVYIPFILLQERKEILGLIDPENKINKTHSENFINTPDDINDAELFFKKNNI